MGVFKFKPVFVLYLLPALALYCVFFIYPFILTLGHSFTSWDGITKPVYVGFANYVHLIHDTVVLSGIVRILIWAALAVLVKVGLGLVFSNLLRERLPGYKFFTGVFFFPVVVSSSAMCLVFTLIYDRNIGMVDWFLRTIGLGFLQTSFLSNPHTAFYAAIAVPIYQDIGFFLVIFLSAIQDIPLEFYEAAKMDGANSIQIFFKVTIPLLLGTLRVCMILAITAAFKTFDYIFLLTGGGPGTITEVPATWMYQETFQAYQYGYGDAIAMLIFIISFVVSGLVLFSSRREQLSTQHQTQEA